MYVLITLWICGLCIYFTLNNEYYPEISNTVYYIIFIDNWSDKQKLYFQLAKIQIIHEI